MIPIWTTTYSVHQFGSTIRRVECEKCSQVYFYELGRVGFGRSTTIYGLNHTGAANQAAAVAHKKLQNQLRRGHDPVPCPRCGEVQKEMKSHVLKVRASQRFVTAMAIWVLVACVVAIALAVAGVTQSGWWAYLLSILALLTWVVVSTLGQRGNDEARFTMIPKNHRVLLAPPALLPQVAESGDIYLVPSNDIGFEEGCTRFVAQFFRHGFPAECLVCLAPAHRLFVPAVRMNVRFTEHIPCCESCNRWLTRRARLVMITVFLLSLCVTWIVLLCLNLPKPGAILATLALFCFLPAVLLVGSRAGRPLSTWNVDKRRGWYGICPRNSTVASRIAEIYSRVELYSVPCPVECLDPVFKE